MEDVNTKVWDKLFAFIKTYRAKRIMADLRADKKDADDNTERLNDKLAYDKRKIYLTNLDEVLKKVKFFPGSIEEYQDMVGYEVRVLDTGDRDMGVTFNHLTNYYPDNIYCTASTERKEVLVKNGIEAIVNCRRQEDVKAADYWAIKSDAVYGLPVTKK